MSGFLLGWQKFSSKNFVQQKNWLAKQIMANILFSKKKLGLKIRAAHNFFRRQNILAKKNITPTKNIMTQNFVPENLFWTRNNFHLKKFV